MFIDPWGLKDVPLRGFVEERGGTVEWDAYSKAAIVDFGSAGKKTYWAGPQKTRKHDSSSSERPYLKWDYVNGEVSKRLYVNDKDIINDFGICDHESRNVPEVGGNVVFTLFYKDKKYYQRMSIDGEEYMYEKVSYRNFAFYTAGGRSRYKIYFEKVSKSDMSVVNKEWKDNFKDFVDVMGAEPAVGTKINLTASVFGFMIPKNFHSDIILTSSDYAIRFRNRSYYIDGINRGLIAYTKYER